MTGKTGVKRQELPTNFLKDSSVKLLAVHRVLFYLPVPSVHNAAMLAAQDEAAAVWNAVCHSQGLNPEHSIPTITAKVTRLVW